MGKRILFSPVGGTDPIRNCRDGSMLHICRYYQPDIVYLYLSHEIMERHRQDDRYVYAINRLGEHLGHSFEVRLIERDDLIDVQQYDRFYPDFREEIRKIEETMEKGDELLLNIASGTPAMKSALMVIATLAEYRFRLIQVPTPTRKMGEGMERDYDNELYWELNEDNDAEAENRCTEVECENLTTMLKIDAIKKHIHAYDYTAALAVATEIRENIPEDIPEEAYTLIRIADSRVKLDGKKISQLMAGQNYGIYPVQQGDRRQLFEYALVLQIKIAKQEYADFIRGVTPLVLDLLTVILKNECNIALEDCCRRRKRDNVLLWDRGKLEGKGLLGIMDDEYQGDFREGPVYSHHIGKIIQHRCEEGRLKQKVEEITRIESAVRNVAAHEIVSVTDGWFQEKTGKTAEEIFKLLKYLTTRARISANEEDWNSYDQMNKKIEAALR